MKCYLNTKACGEFSAKKFSRDLAIHYIMTYLPAVHMHPLIQIIG